jgi:hypothetical protein
VRQATALRNLEQSHVAAAARLEQTFEKRLELECQKLRLVNAEKDDMQFALEEELVRQKQRHAGVLHYMLPHCTCLV